MCAISNLVFVALLAPALPLPEYGTWVRQGVEPVFEETRLVVTVQPGETALLPCRVRNVADKLVSWIRRSDLTILTSGMFVFTGDPRFRVVHPETDPSSWSLQLRNPAARDQGQYECQVNTEPKMTRSVELVVQDIHYPVLDISLRDQPPYNPYGREGAMILGDAERKVRSGSTVSLTCHIRAPASLAGQRPHRLVDWKFFDTPLDSNIAGVFVDTEKNGREISSTITLNTVTYSDTGVYSCTSLYARPASVTLKVVPDDTSAAMIHSPLSGLRSSACLPAATLFFLVLVPLFY